MIKSFKNITFFQKNYNNNKKNQYTENSIERIITFATH